MDRTVTLKDVARRARVSINTVSRALNGTNREVWPSVAHRADRIRALASTMGYRPSAAARAMRSSTSRHVAVVMSGSYQAPYEYPVIMGINERLHDAGYSLTVVSAGETGARDAIVLKERFLAGALVMHVAPSVLECVKEAAERCVHVDSNVRGATCCVYRDERHAGRLAAERMAELGYTRLLYVGTRGSEGCHAHIPERLAGAREGAAARGAKLETMELGYQPAEHERTGAQLAPRLVPSLGVIAGNEEIAEWVSHLAARRGACPGADFGLVSCSDAGRWWSTWPGMSRVTFDRPALGRAAADMLVGMLDGTKTRPRSVALRGEWVAGDTARERTKGD